MPFCRAHAIKREGNGPTGEYAVPVYERVWNHGQLPHGITPVARGKAVSHAGTAAMGGIAVRVNNRVNVR